MEQRFRGFKLHHMAIAIVAISVLLTFAVIASVGFSTGRALWVGGALEAQHLNASKLAGVTDELFASLKSGLKTVAEHADWVVVSQTPQETVSRAINRSFRAFCCPPCRSRR